MAVTSQVHTSPENECRLQKTDKDVAYATSTGKTFQIRAAAIVTAQSLTVDSCVQQKAVMTSTLWIYVDLIPRSADWSLNV